MKEFIPHVQVLDAVMGTGKSLFMKMILKMGDSRQFIVAVQSIDETETWSAQVGLEVLIPLNSEVIVLANRESEGSTSLDETIDSFLISNKSIVITHQKLRTLSSRTLSIIEGMGIFLILDETLTGLFSVHKYEDEDIQILLDRNYLILSEDGKCKTNKDIPEPKIAQKEIYKRLLNKSIEKVSNNTYVSVSSIQGLKLFRHIYLMTYMFSGSEMESYLRMKGFDISIQTISDYGGVQGLDYFDGAYTGSKFKDLISIVDRESVNDIGKGDTALSKNWYLKADIKNLEAIRRHTKNYFKNIATSEDSKFNMVGLFKDSNYAQPWRNKIICRPFKDIPRMNVITEIPINERATNRHNHKHTLAYLVNVFSNPIVGRFLNESGYPIDDERIALSTLIQWVWRSRIRNGEPVKLYLPSERMRTLLDNWLSS